MDFFLIYLALAPCLVLALFIYWRDKHEKEPIPVLLLCLVFGVLCAFPAGYWNTYMFLAMDYDLQGQTGWMSSFFAAFFVVGIGEETCKFMPLMLYAYRKPSFNEPFDGIVYAVMVSLGFAAIENVDYVLEGGMGVAFVRALMAVPMHTAFGVVMGYYVGLAKLRGETKMFSGYCLKGLLCAAALHGAYDFFLFQDDSVLLTLLVFPLMIFALVVCLKAMKSHSARSPFKP